LLQNHHRLFPRFYPARRGQPVEYSPSYAKEKIVNVERIEAILSTVKGPHILNLGCVGHSLPVGPGEKAHWLHLQLTERFPAARIVGLDNDASNVERMREMGFDAVLGDAHDLSYESCFDTIVVGELIEHLQNPGKCLEGCRRALKPEGRIILTTPNAFCAMLGLMYWKNFNRAFNTEHVLWFCPQTLYSLADRCGLRIVKFGFVDDLAPEITTSRTYRLFAHLWMGMRWLLPRRYRNTMFAVCESSSSPTCLQAATEGARSVDILSEFHGQPVPALSAFRAEQQRRRT
jgi:SAM-dependent methyltransferase